MKSFAEWTAVGRAVRKGEKARYRRVNEDRTQSIPLFEEDQTEPLHDVGTNWDVITEQEWQELKAPKKVNPVKLREGTDGYVHVWCGNNKKAIQLLRKAGYFYNMRIHRWCKKGKPLEQIKEGFEHKGFQVEVET